MRKFYKAFPFFEIEELIEYFTFFGGLEDLVELDAFAGLEANISSQLLNRFDEVSYHLSPAYLLDDPYRKFLISVARGDGKMLNVFRRARLSESSGGQIVNELIKDGIIRLEESRETPMRREKGRDIPKEFRGYRIQSKIRFLQPFGRFWFGFVEPHRREIEGGDSGRFWENFHKHKERAQSLIFEQLSNELLVDMYASKDPIISYGGWWDKASEYDIFAITKSGKVILGECKYKGRKVTRAELTKLMDKASKSGINADLFALFSRNGFSFELHSMGDTSLILKDINDFRDLLY